MLHTHSAPTRTPPFDFHQRCTDALTVHRRSRSVSLGPCMWVQFEDELTVQQQIDEVWRCHEAAVPGGALPSFDTYAHLLPDGRQWKATVWLGRSDAEQPACDVSLLNDAARHLYVQLPQLPRVLAKPNQAWMAESATAVHCLRFEFSAPLHVALLAGASASIGCAHPRYPYRRELPLAMLEQLRCDLAQQHR